MLLESKRQYQSDARARGEGPKGTNHFWVPEFYEVNNNWLNESGSSLAVWFQVSLIVLPMMCCRLYPAISLHFLGKSLWLNIVKRLLSSSLELEKLWFQITNDNLTCWILSLQMPPKTITITRLGRWSPRRPRVHNFLPHHVLYLLPNPMGQTIPSYNHSLRDSAAENVRVLIVAGDSSQVFFCCHFLPIVLHIIVALIVRACF